MQRCPAVRTIRVCIEKGVDLLPQEMPLGSTEQLLGLRQGQPEMLDTLGIFVEGDDIGDGLFVTLIVPHNELQFDTHPGASPRSSDRRIAQPILPEFEGYPQHLPALSSAPLPQWKRTPMPGGGAPVVRELPSWTVNNGEWLMVRGGGRTCSPG